MVLINPKKFFRKTKLDTFIFFFGSQLTVFAYKLCVEKLIAQNAIGPLHHLFKIYKIWSNLIKVYTTVDGMITFQFLFLTRF